VVAIVDNEFTLKILGKERGKFILRPENPAFPVIRPQGTLEIFGILIGLIRKYRK
jgi:repressor LexA